MFVWWFSSPFCLGIYNVFIQLCYFLNKTSWFNGTQEILAKRNVKLNEFFHIGTKCVFWFMSCHDTHTLIMVLWLITQYLFLWSSTRSLWIVWAFRDLWGGQGSGESSCPGSPESQTRWCHPDYCMGGQGHCVWHWRSPHQGKGIKVCLLLVSWDCIPNGTIFPVVHYFWTEPYG